MVGVFGVQVSITDACMRIKLQVSIAMVRRNTARNMLMYSTALMR